MNKIKVYFIMFIFISIIMYVVISASGIRFRNQFIIPIASLYAGGLFTLIAVVTKIGE